MTTKDKKPTFTVVSDNKPSESGTPSTTADNLPGEGANDEAVQAKVRLLEEEHRDLDHAITTMQERMPYDRLTLMRMKKRKLALKDKITRLKGNVLPDIIA